MDDGDETAPEARVHVAIDERIVTTWTVWKNLIKIKLKSRCSSNRVGKDHSWIKRNAVSDSIEFLIKILT